MVTIKVTERQAEQLLRATEYLYLSYEYGADEFETSAIRRVNDGVDELRIIIKEAIKNENC